jgi:protein arginine kinase
MNWYLQSSENSDVVKSTRIRLSRNLQNLKFNLNKKEEIEILENKIKEVLFSIGYGLKFLKLKDMDDITKMSLVEKNIISPEFVLNKNETGSILVNDEENICIMIGNEDHIEIQVFDCGLDLENTLNLAIEIDEKIGETLGYSISKKYGYLTACPNNVGTGLKASVMLHLPALSKTKNTKKVLEAINSFGINIRGVYGENAESTGDMYQISNKQTLGITEREIIQNLKVIVEKIIEQERQARKILTKDELALEDLIYRSYGILSNCRKISSEETMKLLSNIKLGTDLGILKELTDLKVQKIYLYTKPANLQKYVGEQYEATERDIKRAEVIQNIMKEN